MDDRFREAERQAKLTGDPGDVARYYLERVRSGLTTVVHLQFAAWIGDQAANVALGQNNLPIPIDELSRFAILLADGRADAAQALEISSDRMGSFMRICTDDAGLELLRNLMTQIKIEVAHELADQAASIHDSMRTESFLTRIGWIPVADQMSEVANNLDRTPIDSAEYRNAVRDAWKLVGGASLSPAGQQKSQEIVAQRIRNAVLHRWGLH